MLFCMGVECTGAEKAANGLVKDALLIVGARELLCEAVQGGADQNVADCRGGDVKEVERGCQPGR